MCGAVFLEEGFEALIRTKLEQHGASDLLTARRLVEARKHFNNSIKTQFNPYDVDCEETFEVPFPGTADVPAMDLEAGYLRLQRLREAAWQSNRCRVDIQRIFDHIFIKILALIEGQMRDVKLKSNAEIKVINRLLLARLIYRRSSWSVGLVPTNTCTSFSKRS
jgi:hypothetical protein